MRNRWSLALLLAAGCALASAAQNKDSVGTMALDKGFGPIDIGVPVCNGRNP